MNGDHLIIAFSMRKEILEHIQNGHLGIAKRCEVSQTCLTVCVVARHRVGHKGMSCLLPPISEDSAPDLALPPHL